MEKESNIGRFNERCAKLNALFWHSGRDNPHHNITSRSPRSNPVPDGWERNRSRPRRAVPEPRRPSDSHGHLLVVCLLGEINALSF